MHNSAARLAFFPKLGKTDLHSPWREVFQKQPQRIFGLLIQILGYRLQEQEFRSLPAEVHPQLCASAWAVKANPNAEFLASPSTKSGPRRCSKKKKLKISL